MSVNSGRGKLYSALKDLRLRWELTREQWKDAVADEFEEHYWNPLESITVGTIAAMDRLEQILLKIKQQCGESESLYYDESASK